MSSKVALTIFIVCLLSAASLSIAYLILKNKVVTEVEKTNLKSFVIVDQPTRNIDGVGAVSGVLFQNLRVVNVELVDTNRAKLKLEYSLDGLSKTLEVELSGGFGFSVGGSSIGSLRVSSIIDVLEVGSLVNVNLEYIPFESDATEYKYREYIIKLINSNPKVDFLTATLNSGFGGTKINRSDVRARLSGQNPTFNLEEFRVLHIRLLK